MSVNVILKKNNNYILNFGEFNTIFDNTKIITDDTFDLNKIKEKKNEILKRMNYDNLLMEEIMKLSKQELLAKVLEEDGVCISLE